jgi:hypothetical protein
MEAVASSIGEFASVEPSVEVGSWDRDVNPTPAASAYLDKGKRILVLLLAVQFAWVAALVYAAYVFLT